MFEPMDEIGSYRPCLVLAHPDGAYMAWASRAFRLRGWDVYPARNGPEARRLAALLDAELVILDTDLPGESGWLTCDKLLEARPLTKVVLVADEVDARAERFAEFVGALAVVERRGGAASLVREVEGEPLPAAV